jgi:hypothetical protein
MKKLTPKVNHPWNPKPLMHKIMALVYGSVLLICSN